MNNTTDPELSRHDTGLSDAEPSDDPSKARPAELFYDLVYVFGLTQTVALLSHDMTWTGLARAGLVLAAIWWLWISTSLELNHLDPDSGPVRTMLFVSMLLTLFVAGAIPQAFDKHSMAFGVMLAVVQVLHTAFTWFSSRATQTPAQKQHFPRAVTWVVATAGLWVAGAWHAPLRGALWGLAVVVQYAGPLVGYCVPGLGRTDMREHDVDGDHLAERTGLFLIIALGESIVAAGTTFEALDWTPEVIAAFVACFVGTVSMWWIYFHEESEESAEGLEGSAGDRRDTRRAFVYGHLPIVAAIVLISVGDKMLLHEPLERADWTIIGVQAGGPALFLATVGLFKRLTLGRWPASHLCGIGVLGLAAVVASMHPAVNELMLVAFASAVLFGVGAVDAMRPAGRTMQANRHHTP